jgi:hypothetical protein
MKPHLKAACTIALIVTELVASTGACMIQPLARTPQSFVFSREPDFSRGMDASVIHPMATLNGIRYEDVAMFIPKDLATNSNSSNVSGHILDHSISSIFNSQAVRNSDLGRSAHKIEHNMQGGVSMSGSGDRAINHAIHFAMVPSQGRAQIVYSGLTDAQISYQAVSAKLDFEVREAVAMVGTDLVYNHIAQNGDRTDMLSMRWKW